MRGLRYRRWRLLQIPSSRGPCRTCCPGSGAPANRRSWPSRHILSTPRWRAGGRGWRGRAVSYIPSNLSGSLRGTRGNVGCMRCRLYCVHTGRPRSLELLLGFPSPRLSPPRNWAALRARRAPFHGSRSRRTCLPSPYRSPISASPAGATARKPRPSSRTRCREHGQPAHNA